MAPRVLIIDDEDVFREDLAGLLRRRHMECHTAASGKQGIDLVDSVEPEVILCDVNMPGMNGVETLDEIMRRKPDSSVIMITAYGDMNTAIAAFRKGASDYIVKPIIVDDVVTKVQRLVELKHLSQEVRFLRRQVSRESDGSSLIGQSEAMRAVVRLVEDVAQTRSTVLVTGESGTGKELVARSIHNLGETHDHPFVPINCAGIPDSLLESELFGHVKGAFTGALSDHVGYLQLAEEGTILLDEIGEMSLALQSKLLRVLEQREFVPVGSTKARPLCARIITATNRDLRRLVEEQRFRNDLYFRIAVLEIAVPPLRLRRSDIPALAEHFIHKLNEELKRQCRGVSQEAMRCLLAYSWPGNVRELRNVLERALILNRGEYINASDLPETLGASEEAAVPMDDLRGAVRAFERDYLMRVLSESNGNKEEAARRLGVNPSTIYRKMADLEI